MSLQCFNVNKSFGGLQSIKDLDFKIERSQITSLIGPNGAGKTTVFNVISGHLKPDAGQIIFNEKDITGWSPHRIVEKGISRTFQISRPFSSMTVLETVSTAFLYGRKKVKNLDEAKKMGLEILEFVKLADKKEHRSGALSVVDQRRLEISRALATGPELVMLDEVMAGLNDKELVEVLEIIEGMRTKLGMTVLIIEHVMKAIMSLSNSVIVLHNGQKIAEGSPKEIARNDAVIDAYLGGENTVGALS